MKGMDGSNVNAAPFVLNNAFEPQTAGAPYGTIESTGSLTPSSGFNAPEYTEQYVEEQTEPTKVLKEFTLTNKIVYLRTTCASCDGPLDRSELDLNIEAPTLRCAQHESANHPPFSCDVPGCGLRFAGLNSLKEHSQDTRHKSFHCAIPTCHIPLANSYSSSLEHFRLSHPDIGYQCAKCSEMFETHEELNRHCQSSQHAGYVCRFDFCGAEAMRLADLNRHQLIHRTSIPRHPCPHCREYRGKNGFKRKDHLTQHIRNYHRIHVERAFRCPLDCFSHWQKCATLELLTKHAQSAHQSLPFVCKEMGCDRVGMNGFENDQLLKVHVKENHLPPYQCWFPGCDRVGEKGWKRARDMVKHMEKKHGQSAVGDTTV